MRIALGQLKINWENKDAKSGKTESLSGRPGRNED